MKIEIWSDVVCPFCYIGKRRFEEALQTLGKNNDIEIIYRSFQLDPNAKKNYSKDLHSVLANKYNTWYEEAKGMNERVANQAKEVGLEFNFDQAIHTNTEDAHRLSHYAKRHGKMYELMELLMKAYFTDGLDVSDFHTLATLAEQSGLSRDGALKVLESGDYRGDVREDISLASQFGVQGVPFFVFNRKYAVSGAQPTEVFIEVLQKVYEEEKEEPKLEIVNEKKTKTEYCDDDSCGV